LRANDLFGAAGMDPVVYAGLSALIVGALMTVIAIPLIGRRGTQPESKAILLRDYSANLALLLGMTAAIAVVLYALRVQREHRPPDAPPGSEAK